MTELEMSPDDADLRALLDGVASTVTPNAADAWASIEARLRGSVVALPVASDTDDPVAPVELDMPLAAVDGRATRWHRRRAVLAVAAAAAVVLGVVGVLAAERGDQRPADERSDVYPHLTYVPDGLENTGAFTTQSLTQQSSVGDAATVIESSDGMRGYVVEARMGFVELTYAPMRDVDLGGGRVARQPTDGEPSLTWTEQRLTVNLRATGVAAADDAELLRVARGIRVVRDRSLGTTLEATDLPDGFRVAWRGLPSVRYPAAQANVSFARRGDLTAATDETLTGTVLVMSPGVPAVAWFGSGREVAVQGHRAVLAVDGSGPLPAESGTTVTWSPEPGVLAAVNATGLGEEELLRAAEGFRFVSRSTFRADNPSVEPGIDAEPAPSQPLGTTVAEGTAGDVRWRMIETDVSDCYALEVGGGASSYDCGLGAGDTGLGKVLSTPAGDGYLVVVLASGDPAAIVAEVDDREVARAAAPEAVAAGRSERVLAMFVPGDPSSVMLHARRADGSELDRTVWQLRSGAPQAVPGAADPVAMKEAPVLQSGTIEGSTPWSLRGGQIPEIDFGPNGVEKTGRMLPCVALYLGARDAPLLLCEGFTGPDTALGASEATSTSEPRNAVLAFVYDSVRSYRLTYADGRTATVETVTVPGLTGRRAVLFLVGRDEHLVGVTPVRADGTEGPGIPVDMPGTDRTTFRLGEQAALFGADDETPGGSPETGAPATAAP